MVSPLSGPGLGCGHPLSASPHRLGRLLGALFPLPGPARSVHSTAFEAQEAPGSAGASAHGFNLICFLSQSRS